MDVVEQGVYRGLDVALTLRASAVSPRVLARDDAEARIRRVLDHTRKRIAAILVVAEQDDLRDELAARFAAARLPVVRIEVGDVRPPVDVVLQIAAEEADPEQAAAAAQQIVDAVLADRFGAQE